MGPSSAVGGEDAEGNGKEEGKKLADEVGEPEEVEERSCKCCPDEEGDVARAAPLSLEEVRRCDFSLSLRFPLPLLLLLLDEPAEVSCP